MSNYDVWKTRSPDDTRDRFDNYNLDDRVDFDEDDECDHVDYAAYASGVRACHRCGGSWRPTQEQLDAELAVARENEAWHRRQARRALWRKVWQRLLGKRAAKRDGI
jgi:hypothetical protein